MSEKEKKIVATGTTTGSSTVSYNVDSHSGCIDKVKLRKVLQAAVNKQQDFDYTESQSRLGRVLTVVDSAIQDPEQRKATKDLVHSAWYQYGGLPGNETELMFACEALGFDLWDSIEGQNVAAQTAGPINPYKDLVK